MNILAFDTSTEMCVAALLAGEHTFEVAELQPRGHTQRLLPMLESLLKEAGLSLKEIDVIAYGRGPGSFTGVRIAVSAAQGLGFALECPVIGISSLAAMAQRACDEFGASAVLPAFDARMNEVYWGAYLQNDKQLVALQGCERVVPPEAVEIPVKAPWIAVGTGWGTWQTEMEQALGFKPGHIVPDYFPGATALVKLAAAAYKNGEAITAESATPVYLRNQVAEKSAK